MPVLDRVSSRHQPTYPNLSPRVENTMAALPFLKYCHILTVHLAWITHRRHCLSELTEISQVSHPSPAWISGGREGFGGREWQPPSRKFDCILLFPNTRFPAHFWYTNMVRVPMLVSMELDPMLRSICTAFRHGMQARPMRCFRCWRLPMGFWRVAWLLFCFLVAGCALLDIFMAASGDAILPAKTPRPCAKMPANSETTRCRADHHRLAVVVCFSL